MTWKEGRRGAGRGDSERPGDDGGGCAHHELRRNGLLPLLEHARDAHLRHGSSFEVSFKPLNQLLFGVPEELLTNLHAVKGKSAFHRPGLLLLQVQQLFLVPRVNLPGGLADPRRLARLHRLQLPHLGLEDDLLLLRVAGDGLLADSAREIVVPVALQGPAGGQMQDVGQLVPRRGVAARVEEQAPPQHARRPPATAPNALRRACRRARKGQDSGRRTASLAGL